MTIATFRRGSEEFQHVLDAVARELVSATMEPDGAFIKTSLTYPGGSAVVVRVSEDAQGYFVTDFGLGLDEAVSMGIAPAVFARYAHAVADSTGTRFDNHSFFALNASREQLAGAIVAVANASHSTVAHTMFGAADKSGRMETQLFERLRSAFRDRPARVLKQAEVRGYSNTPWRVDALVRAGERIAAFDFVSNHPASVAATTTKFYDIARLGAEAPKRIAVVRNRRELGTYLNVLSQAGSVIEDAAPDEAFVRLAEAA